MPSKRILCVGLVCVDLIQVCTDYPNEDSDQRSVHHRWQRGGNASNNCTVLAKCGHVCEFFGTMSDDILAKYAKQDFENHHIITKNIVNVKKIDSPFSSVIINARNGSRTIIHSNKNMPDVTLEDFKKLDLEQYCWIHFEGRNIKQVVFMLEHVSHWNSTHHPITTSVELEKPKEEMETLLPLADVVFIGKDFALFQGCNNKNEALNKYITLVKPRATVVIAWGESGAIGRSSDSGVVESPAFLSGKVMDTLGAGDTFLAATILCLAKGYDLKKSLATGCRVAGTKICMEGFSGLHPGLLEE